MCPAFAAICPGAAADVRILTATRFAATARLPATMAPRRCLGATLLWVCGSVTSTAAQTYPIDGSALGVALNSVGAQSTAGTARLLYDYPEKQRAEILDLLFKPSYGASFQHLKVESELARSGLAMPLPVAIP